MTATALAQAGDRIDDALARSARRPWNRGLWLTARCSYGPIALSPRLRVEEVSVGRVTRRIARADGWRHPLLILPGLYARLEESLFAEIADRAAAAGFPVILLEDRLAAPTLRATSGSIPALPALGEEAALVARSLDSRPDVLALSAGLAVGLAAPPDAFRSIVGWSGVVDFAGVAKRVAAQPLLHWYYRHVHGRAFSDAGLRPPSLASLVDALAPPPPRPGSACTLLIHAADDPVVPTDAAVAIGRERHHVVRVVPRGGHLGFGLLAGPDIYLSPFLSADAS